LNPEELLAGVTVFETGTSPAATIALRLLQRLGARKVGERRLSRLAFLAPRDGTDAPREQPGGPQTVVVVEDERDDLLLQAAAGICAGIGAPNRPPLKLSLDQSARQGGLAIALAAVASLFSGESQQVRLSILEVWSAFYSGPDVANARFGRSKTQRGGHRALGVPWPRTILPCKDGYFAIQCATREHWQRFLKLVGKPELESAPIFADRIRANDLHGDEADAIFSEWFGNRTKAELTREFLAAKIPGAPVYRIDEVARHEHLRERSAFDHAGRANVPYALTSSSQPIPIPPVTRSGPAHAPLEGVRVVDFGWVWAGAVPGHILADLGAEVIKIETATRLDYMRQGKPIVGTQRDPEQNPMFQSVNRGKLSFRIDMTRPQGAALIRELAAASDVVIENFSPGVLERQGLGWPALSNVSPGLIMCSMSAAGASGPLRDIRTYATMIAGLCGLDSMVGYSGERVLGSQSSYCDPNASLHATLAVLAALYARGRSGCGCWIDLSQWQAGLHAVEDALERYAADGFVPAPCGISREDRLVYGCFPTADPDGWVAISVRDRKELDLLEAVLGNEMASDDTIAEATAQVPAEELLRRLPPTIAVRIVRAGDVAGDPQLRASELFQEIGHPILGDVPVYRLPWRVNGQRINIRKRAPYLGEHNDYVLKEILHVSPERVEELRVLNVFT